MSVATEAYGGVVAERAATGHRQVVTPMRRPSQWSTPEMQTALDMVGDTVFLLEPATLQLIEVNAAACSSLGYSRRELLAMCLLDVAPQADHGPVGARLDEVARGLSPVAKVPTVHRHRDGRLFQVEWSVRRVETDDAMSLVVVALDTREAEPLEQHSCREALRDGLTGLPDRRSLTSRLRLALDRARREDYRFALLFVDVDRFKQVNDTLGHLAGDQVLCDVARHLTASVRPADLVARYGGDEFVVLLDDVQGSQEVCQIAERLQRRGDPSAEGDGVHDPDLGVTLSIGIAISGDARATAEDLIGRADRAMYRAKALGRDGRWVLDDADNQRSSGRNGGHGYP